MKSSIVKNIDNPYNLFMDIHKDPWASYKYFEWKNEMLFSRSNFLIVTTDELVERNNTEREFAQRLREYSISVRSDSENLQEKFFSIRSRINHLQLSHPVAKANLNQAALQLPDLPDHT